MNYILDKLYLHYEKLIVIYRDDCIILNSSEKNNELHAIDTFSILTSLRILLFEKNYQEAKLKLNLLTLDNNILVELSDFIKELESGNINYNLIGYHEQATHKVITDNMDADINLVDNSKLDILQKDIKFITQSLAKFERIESNHTDLITKVHELNETVRHLLNTISNEKSSAISQESIEQISQFVKILQSENENIIGVAKKISSLNPELHEINNLVTNNITEVKDSYFKACKLLSEQTIQQVGTIKDTTLKTVDLVSQDLPNRINQIVDEVLVKVDKSIKGNQRGNFIFFSVILFVITFFACWWFGTISGEKSSSNIIHYMEKSFVPQLFKPINNNK